ncbi:hypothetical protein KY289_001331 [Solanum tuberosum]|nr:hypothetical protein KY289_001331 [Solanum tuberosum]
MKFDGSHNMQNHIIEMTNISSRLRTLGMKVDDTFLDKCDVSELSSMLTQEESKLKKQGGYSINLMGQGAGHNQKDCPKHKAWFEKKGFTTIQATNPNKEFLFMGNHMEAQIEGMGTYRLILENGHHLDIL